MRGVSCTSDRGQLRRTCIRCNYSKFSLELRLILGFAMCFALDFTKTSLLSQFPGLEGEDKDIRPTPQAER